MTLQDLLNTRGVKGFRRIWKFLNTSYLVGGNFIKKQITNLNFTYSIQFLNHILTHCSEISKIS